MATKKAKTELPAAITDDGRMVKMERIVRAALGLRKVMIDDGPHTSHLSVPRDVVERFDRVVAEASKKNEN